MAVRLTKVSGPCLGESCPTVYETDRGTFVIQGFDLDAEARGCLTLAEGEDAVEIPAEVLKSVLMSEAS